MNNAESFIHWLPLLIRSIPLTLGVGIIALLISIVLGMLVALCCLSSSRPLRIIGVTYTTIIRGIPELVLILLVYYGAQQLINDWRFERADKLGIDIEAIDFSPFWAGAIIIGLIYAAYMAETFRGAIIAVPSGQIEAARAYGLPQKRIFFRITFPQMLRHALPGISNNWLVMLKATALVSLIALPDIVKLSFVASKKAENPFPYLLFAGVVFLLFTSVSVIIFRYLEERYSIGAIRRG